MSKSVRHDSLVMSRKQELLVGNDDGAIGKLPTNEMDLEKLVGNKIYEGDEELRNEKRDGDKFADVQQENKSKETTKDQEKRLR